MERWQGKVAVVTGASAGIGAAIAKDLVKAGMIVVGLARRKEKMETEADNMNIKKGGKFYAKKCDLFNEQEILDVFSWIEAELGGVDVIVNNAGVTKTNMLTNPRNSEDLRGVLDINVMALCICTREAFRSMKKRDVAGHIIHINSILGHAVPYLDGFSQYFNMYPGSKYCVTALTESVRQELIDLDNKTKITSISPGYVITEFLKTLSHPGIENRTKSNKKVLSSEDVSQAVLYVLGTPPHVQIQELTIKPIGERV